MPRRFLLIYSSSLALISTNSLAIFSNSMLLSPPPLGAVLVLDNKFLTIASNSSGSKGLDR